MNDLQKEFIDQSIFRLQESAERIFSCMQEIGDEQLWLRPNESSNSIGNIILHLCGNIRQYAVSSLGNQPDTRMRDLEFSTQEGFTKDELADRLRSTLEEAIQTIRSLDEESLIKTRTVQGFHLTGIGIIIHVTEHLSYHTGQVAFWVKCLKNKDLGFYAGIDLNTKNKS